MRIGSRKIIQDLRGLRDTSSPYSCYFITGISDEKRDHVEAILKERFLLWWDSWVAPRLAELEEKLPKKKERR